MMRSRTKKRKQFQRARERARLDFGPEPASVLADAAATLLSLPLELGGDEEAEADAIRGIRSLDQDTEAAEAKAMVMQITKSPTMGPMSPSCRTRSGAWKRL